MAFLLAKKTKNKKNKNKTEKSRIGYQFGLLDIFYKSHNKANETWKTITIYKTMKSHCNIGIVYIFQNIFEDET